MFFSTNLNIFNDFFGSKSGKIFSLRVRHLKIQETNFAKNSTRFIFKRICTRISPLVFIFDSPVTIYMFDKYKLILKYYFVPMLREIYSFVGYRYAVV